MDFNQCISMLTKASSDNEKMAAMLMAAKLIKSGDIGCEERKKIFNAIGFNFLNRLLATKDIPEGCSENPYQALSVTVLACFCTDIELALHPQVTSKIPLFNDCISQCIENVSLAEDALQCLQGISSSCTGCRHLLRPGYSTLQALGKCFCTQTSVSGGAENLMLYILQQPEVRANENFPTHLSSLLTFLAKEFKSNPDNLKFQLCELFNKIIVLVADSFTQDLTVRESQWVGDVAAALSNILTSKLDSAHRDPALHLSALLCQLCGLQWAAAVGHKFLLLLVDLFKVEARLAIDGRELSDICSSSELLTSCFIVFESTIAHILRGNDHTSTEGTLLSEESLLHLHTTLTESFVFILSLLKQLELTTETDFSLDTFYTKTSPLIIACVRVIGAWLAEDSISISTDLHSCLPFLLRLARLTDCAAAETEGKDLLKFLLPGLSHLTAEERPRRILIQAGLWSILQAHLQRLLSEHSKSIEIVCDRLRLCCEVMVNMCVCEPTLFKDDTDIATTVSLILEIFGKSEHLSATSVMAYVPDHAPPSCPILKMNTLLLFILIANKTSSDQISTWIRAPFNYTLKSILHHLVTTLSCCPGVRSLEDHTLSPLPWEDISEMWFISMQELSQSSHWKSDLIAVAIEGDYVQQLTTVLATIGEHSKGNEQLESIAAALCVFLQAVTQ